MNNKSVLYEVNGPVARVTLNRPDKLNALNAAVVSSVRECVDRVRRDDDVKVVILRGAGTAFSAGFDISEEVDLDLHTAEAWREVLATDVDMTMDLWSLPKPTIASVQGYCLAGGLELALACDMVLCAEGTQFGEPEIRYGSGPVTLLLPFIVGEKKANELLFTGDLVEAQEALRLGLVNRVVPAATLDDEAQKLALRIAPTPLTVLRYTKLALRRAQEAMGLRAAVQANLDLSAVLNAAATPEQEEFDRIVAEGGLRAALDWRDGRYGSLHNRTARTS